MINTLMKTFLMLLVVVALLPVAAGVLMSLSPGLLALVIVFGAAVLRPIRYLFMGTVRALTGAITALLGGLFKALGWLIGATLPTGDRHARFMGFWERFFLLNRWNRGFLVDGRKSRLSENATYESFLIQGGMGRGKSSTFVMPNLLSFAASTPSTVILDTSGEIHAATSGYLRRQGYQIRTLNLMAPYKSDSWNPLDAATTPQTISEIAQILIRSSSGGVRPTDPFWEQSAMKLLRILIQCLANQPDPSLRNLANLRHLITSFDAHMAPPGQLSKLDQFVLSATAGDPGTFQSYRAFTAGNLKTIQSVLMTADTALDPVAPSEIAALTGTSSINFTELRRRKTAVYLIVNETQIENYAFLLSLFCTGLFRALLQNPRNPGRPVYLYLDEFGHLNIPGFETFATTARKYHVAFAIFVQSLAQLEHRYGRANAQIIREGLGTEIYLPGASLETARDLEARLGRMAKAPLMSAADITRLPDNRALMLHSNRAPILLRTKRYFERSDLRARSRLRPAPPPKAHLTPPPLIQL